MFGKSSLQYKMMAGIIGLIIGAAFLTIGQVWGPLLSWALYTKIMITVGILILMVGLVIVLKADLGEHKALKDENYLD